MMEIVLGLAAILTTFRFENVVKQDPALDAWITLRPKNPILVCTTKQSAGQIACCTP
jgi:hypothetical protein